MGKAPVVCVSLVASVLETGYLCFSIIHADSVCEGQQANVCPITWPHPSSK